MKAFSYVGTRRVFRHFVVVAVMMLQFNFAMATPDENPSPTDRIDFVGAIPDDVEAVLVEDWYATNRSIFCEHAVGEAGFMRDRFVKTAKLILESSGQRSWAVWRDELLPGICGWTLREVHVYLDLKASGRPPVRPSNIPIRVAYVCGPADICGNTWASNDDPEKPTYHRCKFSNTALLAPGNALNSCAFFDERARGKDEGKYEHILKSGQHSVRFVITDVGASSQ